MRLQKVLEGLVVGVVLVLTCGGIWVWLGARPKPQVELLQTTSSVPLVDAWVHALGASERSAYTCWRGPWGGWECTLRVGDTLHDLHCSPKEGRCWKVLLP